MQIVAAIKVRANSVAAEVTSAGENRFATLNIKLFKDLKTRQKYQHDQMRLGNHIGDFLTWPETLQICNKKLATVDLDEQNRRSTQNVVRSSGEREPNRI